MKQIRTYKFVDVPADGSCMFWAISKGLERQQGIYRSAQQLRNDAAAFLEKNKNKTFNGMTVKEWTCESSCKIKKFQKELGKIKGGRWGGHLEAWALANFYKTRIKIYLFNYSTNIAQQAAVLSAEDLPEKRKKNPIRILNTGSHYMYLTV